VAHRQTHGSDAVSDSDNGVKRPNAKYKLSKPDNAVVNEEDLVFYYNREQRLSKAPQHVRDLYKEKKPNRLGFLGVLVGDRSRKMLFFTIILLCALIWLFSFLGFLDSPYNLDGNLVKVSASVYENTTIVVINKRNKSMGAYTGAVEAAISVPAPSQEGAGEQTEFNAPVFYHKIFFTNEKEERYSIAVPFESPELLIVLATEKKSIKLKAPVKSVD